MRIVLESELQLTFQASLSRSRGIMSLSSTMQRQPEKGLSGLVKGLVLCEEKEMELEIPIQLLKARTYNSRSECHLSGKPIFIVSWKVLDHHSSLQMVGR